MSEYLTKNFSIFLKKTLTHPYVSKTHLPLLRLSELHIHISTPPHFYRIRHFYPICYTEKKTYIGKEAEISTAIIAHGYSV